MSEQNPEEPNQGGDSRSETNSQKVDAFMAAFHQALTSLRLEMETPSGNRATIRDADGRRTVVDLANLLRFVAPKPRSEWRPMLVRYLESAGPAAMARVQSALTAGLAANAERLLPCVKPAIRIQGQGVPWFQPLDQPDSVSAVLSAAMAEGKLPEELAAHVEQVVTQGQNAEARLWLLLGIDFPTTTLYVSDDVVEASGRPATEWLERAYQNLLARTPREWVHVLDKPHSVSWSIVNDGYDAARALLLDRLYPGAAEKGWFVAPVGQHNMYFMPANPATTNKMLLPLKRMAEDEFPKESKPISNEIYWVYEGRWYRYPILMFAGHPIATPPEKFARVFGMLGGSEKSPTKY